MQSLQTIKQRLKSVKNIGQITKAMELVAATKMRRSQEVALLSRPYAYAALEFLANLSRVSAEKFMPPLFEKRAIERTAVVVIASDKGLTGSFNSAVFRVYETYFGAPTSEISGHVANVGETRYIAVGQKAISFLQRRVGKVDYSFVKFGDYTTVEEVHPLSRLLVEGYLKREWDRVLVFYTNFQSAMQQNVVVREIFPITFEKLKEIAQEIIPQTGKYAAEGHGTLFQEAGLMRENDYIIEPSPEVVLTELVPHLVVMQVYHIILETNASEHAARRMAMKNASDNASEIVDTLTLEYNKSRQAGITKELTEITAGAEALN